jgi:D-alanyl-D-alanine carboxypeptidase (penicillin-binding protein 5/6)
MTAMKRNVQGSIFNIQWLKEGIRSSMHSFDLRILVIAVLFILLVLHFSLLLSYADDVSARAAAVIDGTSGNILYAKNPNVKLFPASTTKLVTAMVVLDKLDPETVVTISEEAARTPSVSPHLRVGEKLKVRDLLNIALIRSVNSAAVALAEAVSGSEEAFAKLMNDKALSIGAENTRYVNASGLPGDGQYITAYDLSLIMKESLRYPMIKEIINTRAQKVYTEGGRRILVKNTNQLLWSDEDVVGGKTGYTRAAKHCFVCAGQKGDKVVIAAVLGESVRSELWHDASTLLARGEDVLGKKREPEIYYTSVSQTPVVYASQKLKKKQKGTKSKSATKVTKKGKAKRHKGELAKKKVKNKKSSEVSAENRNAAKGIS